MSDYKYLQYKANQDLFRHMSLECIANYLGVSQDTVSSYSVKLFLDTLREDEE